MRRENVIKKNAAIHVKAKSYENRYFGSLKIALVMLNLIKNQETSL